MNLTAAAAPGLRHRLNEYYELCKPRVVMLIVFTAIVGMFLAVPGLPPLDKLIYADAIFVNEQFHRRNFKQ